jgi:nucleotide-binding universal stress UspA family protein
MKTILVPTDYSKTANNAVNYAAALAQLMKAKLILVHAYHVPPQINRVPFTTITEVQLERENARSLKQLAARIKKKAPGANIDCVARNGFAADVIKDISAEKKADLVVMGITGAGAVGEAVLGSVAVDTVRNVNVPVIIVPGNVKFSMPGKIVFAYDYAGENDQQAITALVDIARVLESKLMVVNVIREDDTATFKKAIAGIKMESVLARVPHTLHFPVNNSVTEGVNEFVKDTGAGMVAMIAHEHNIFYRLFNMSSTKRMAFHTSVPLLAIPEKLAEKHRSVKAGKKLLVNRA